MSPQFLKREPVRVYLYTVSTAALGYLVYKNVITVDEVPYLGGVIAAILGVEGLRSKVTPVANQISAPEPAPVEQPPAQ